MNGRLPCRARDRIWKRALGALCWLTIAISSATFAEAIELRFEATTPDPVLEDLLYFAIGLELSESGFSSTRTPGGPLVLFTAYEATDAGVRLVLTFSRTAGPVALATTEAVVPFSDSFDAEVGQAVRELLRRAPELASDPSPGLSIEGVFPEPLPPPPPEPLPTTVSGFMEAWAGGLGVLGPLAEVAQYGVGAGLGGGLFWLDDAWSLRVVTRVSTTRALLNQGVTGGSLYLSAATVGVDWGTGRGLPLRLMVGGSLGVAVLTVSGSSVRSKTVPLIDGAASLSLPAFGFFFGGELRFQAAFENNLILGLSPALSVGKEL